MPRARTSSAVAAVREFMQGTPDATIDQLLKAFPDMDPWKLRLARREALTRLQASAMGDFAQPELEMQMQASTLGKLALRAGFFRPIRLDIEARTPPVPKIKSPGRTSLVFADPHAPAVSFHALDVVIQIGQALGIERLIIAGDFFDVHSLSRYTPKAERPFRWVDERMQAVRILAMIRAEFPHIPIEFLFGNHEYRVDKFIASHVPQLQGLFSTPTLLGIDDFGLIFPDRNRVFLAGGKLLVKHGHKVSKHAGASVKAEIEDNGMSVIMGHVHRRALIEVTRTAQRIKGEQPLLGCELGCLCSLDPDYFDPEQTANWQHGCAVVTEYDDGTFDVESVRILDGRATFRGLLFESRRDDDRTL